MSLQRTFYGLCLGSLGTFTACSPELTIGGGGEGGQLSSTATSGSQAASTGKAATASSGIGSVSSVVAATVTAATSGSSTAATSGSSTAATSGSSTAATATTSVTAAATTASAASTVATTSTTASTTAVATASVATTAVTVAVSSSSTGVGPICGNGSIEAGEECDDGATQNDDACSSICMHQRVLQVCAGAGHACAILSGGIVKCWGDNDVGQLGTGDFDARGNDPGEMGSNLAPVNLDGVPAAELACGNMHTCALLVDGEVRCWGNNTIAELGIGSVSPSQSNVPAAAVDLGSGVVVDHIAAGSGHTCALLSDGKLKCWGFNFHGQCGQPNGPQYIGYSPNDMGENLLPIDLGFDLVTQVAPGNFHTCALTQNGTVRCWGYNQWGQLARMEGNTQSFGVPGSGQSIANSLVVPLGGVAVELGGGAGHHCARMANGETKCWGWNDAGQLGINSVSAVGAGLGDVIAPALTGGLLADRLAVGINHNCVRALNGGITCWGTAAFGALCIGNIQNQNMGDAFPPNEMPGALEVVDFGPGLTPIQTELGLYFGCSVLSDYSVKCWGYGADGQLGQGDVQNRCDEDIEQGAALPRVKLFSNDW